MRTMREVDSMVKQIQGRPISLSPFNTAIVPLEQPSAASLLDSDQPADGVGELLARLGQRPSLIAPTESFTDLLPDHVQLQALEEQQLAGTVVRTAPPEHHRLRQEEPGSLLGYVAAREHHREQWGDAVVQGLDQTAYTAFCARRMGVSNKLRALLHTKHQADAAKETLQSCYISIPQIHPSTPLGSPKLSSNAAALPLRGPRGGRGGERETSPPAGEGVIQDRVSSGDAPIQ
jgi:hypothetical protein